MTQVDVDARLLVDDGAGGSRAASVNDYKTPATGAASETNLSALKTANHTDLQALATALATLATDAHFQTFVAANHTDLAALLAKNEAIRALLAGTLLVVTGPDTITAGATNGSGDGLGDVVTYTQTLANGTVYNWTDTYNSDGTLHSSVHA